MSVSRAVGSDTAVILLGRSRLTPLSVCSQYVLMSREQKGSSDSLAAISVMQKRRNKSNSREITAAKLCLFSGVSLSGMPYLISALLLAAAIYTSTCDYFMKAKV